MATDNERIAQLEQQVNSLNAQLDSEKTTSAQYAEQVQSLTEQRDKSAHEAAHATRLLKEHNVSAATPVEQTAVSPDAPRWLYRFDGGMSTTGRLLPNLEEEKKLKASEADTWFEKGADAEAAYFRRKHAEANPAPPAPHAKKKAKPAPAPAPEPAPAPKKKG